MITIIYRFTIFLQHHGNIECTMVQLIQNNENSNKIPKLFIHDNFRSLLLLLVSGRRPIFTQNSN